MTKGNYKNVLGLKKFLLIFAIVISFIALIYFSDDVITIQESLLVSIVTFIYGFFLHSIFKFTETKHALFKEKIADLIGEFQTLYNLIKFSKQKELLQDIRKQINEYIKEMMEIDPEFYENLQERINSFYNSIGNFKIRNEKDRNIHKESLECLARLSKTRETLEVFGDRYLVGEIKWVYLGFTALMIFVIFMVSSTIELTLLIGGALILILVFLTQLIFDMDNLSYGSFKISEDNLEELRKLVSS